MSDFKDYFSTQAPEYAEYRPTYPSSLIDFLVHISPAQKLAWDAGCGSGQLSTLLGDKFERVIATDASQTQISNAVPHPHVEYICTTENTRIPRNSVDLAVAAQAAHWFNLPLYYQEVNRVLGPGGVIALITYGLMSVNKNIDAIIKPFYSKTLASYWPPERHYVEEGYRSLPFPFDEISAPQMEICHHWSLMQLFGYIHTWSAVNALVKTTGEKKMEELYQDIAKAWGPADKLYPIRWPLSMRCGHLLIT